MDIRKLKILAYLVVLITLQACGNNTDSNNAASTADTNQPTPVDPFLEQPTLMNQFVANEVTTVYAPIILFNNDGVGLAVWNAYAAENLSTGDKYPVENGIYLSWYDGVNWSEEKLIAASDMSSNLLQAQSNGSNFMIVWSDREFFNALTIDIVNSKPIVNPTKRLAYSQTWIDGWRLADLKLTRSGGKYGIMTYSAGDPIVSNDPRYGIKIFTLEESVWANERSVLLGGYYGSYKADFVGGDLGFALAWIDNDEKGNTTVSSMVYSSNEQTWSEPVILAEIYASVVSVVAGKNGYITHWATSQNLQYAKIYSTITKNYSELTIPEADTFYKDLIAPVGDSYMIFDGPLFLGMQTLAAGQTIWQKNKLPFLEPCRPNSCMAAANSNTLALVSKDSFFVLNDQFKTISIFDDSSLNLSDYFVVKPLDNGGFGVVYRYNEQALRCQEYDPATGWQSAVEIGSLPRASYETAMAVNPKDGTVWVTWIAYGDAAGGTYEKLNVSSIKDGSVQTTTLKHIPRPPKM